MDHVYVGEKGSNIVNRITDAYSDDRTSYLCIDSVLRY